jgi:hypothetical protein
VPQTGTLQQALVNVTPDDAKRSIFGDLMNDFPYALNSARLYLERVEYPATYGVLKFLNFSILNTPLPLRQATKSRLAPGMFYLVA